jgi:hypothetical protein
MSLLKGFHKHHIVPRYQGGGDEASNLVLLHPIDHAIAHLVRYRMFGNIRDRWASNWLQKIVDTEVYTQCSKEREATIKHKRSIDPEFDAYMKQVRSNATKHRKEGYQTQAGQEFKKRLAEDSEYAFKVRENRKKANKLSVEVRRKAVESKVSKVRSMRASGASYSQIQKATGYSLGAISNIVNGKSLAGVGEVLHA